jgi:hypothetical protein
MATSMTSEGCRDGAAEVSDGCSALVDMGFNASEAQRALDQCGGSIDEAAMLMLSVPLDRGPAQIGRITTDGHEGDVGDVNELEPADQVMIHHALKLSEDEERRRKEMVLQEQEEFEAVLAASLENECNPSSTNSGLGFAPRAGEIGEGVATEDATVEASCSAALEDVRDLLESMGSASCGPPLGAADEVGIDDLPPFSFGQEASASFSRPATQSKAELYGQEASASFSRPATQSKAELSPPAWPPEPTQTQWPAPIRNTAKDLAFHHLKDLPPLCGPRQPARSGGLGASSSAPLLTAASSIMTTNTRR